MNNIELLSPAGDYECLENAVDFGCNAVYLGGKTFGMRANPKNFDMEALSNAVRYAHSKNVKVYLTCNTVPTNDEAALFPEFIKEAAKTGIDAVIAADIGVMAMIRKYAPDLEIHASTQVGVMNYETANELYRLGARRVVLAREVSIEEIKKIRANIPEDMEIEAFVHGAMCVSFSGRCLLSKYLVDRDANRGACAQPCRWKYFITEEKRIGQDFEITEDDRGTYILNAKDLCMIEHLKELIDAGVTSFKIEGRAKSAYYVATVTNAYRKALDCAVSGEDAPEWVLGEVYKVSHRRYCTGFFFNHDDADQYYEDSGYFREYDFVGVINGYSDGVLDITQRNYFTIDDELEVLPPMGEPVSFKPTEIFNLAGESVTIANHAMEQLKIPYATQFPKNSIIRKPSNDRQGDK